MASRSLSTEQRDAALILDGQIFAKLGDATAARTALAQIPGSSRAYATALVIEAEQMIHEARALSQTSGSATDDRAAAKAKYQEAIEKLEAAQSRGDANSATALKAMFLIGECRMERGELQAALAQFDRVRNSNPKTAEGVAAAFQSADLLRQAGRIESANALFRQVVQEIGDPDGYRNDYLSLDGVRKQLLDAYAQYLLASQFEAAATLSRLMRPLFPRERELELTAELLRSAAKTYIAKAAAASPDQGKALLARARANLRRAGNAIIKLAELHTSSRSYTDDLWNAAECYSAGHDYKQAAATLKQYLQSELRRRRSSALAMLGESQLALGDTDKAISTLQECLGAYPNDPVSYQVRVLLAKAYLEKSETDKAEPLLKANLEDANLTPRSAEWRDSLFELGALLASAGRSPEAIQRLDEAVARYPDAPQALEARYLIAQSYQRLGQLAQQRFETDTIETLRDLHGQQMRQNLTAAIEQYEKLQTLLTDPARQSTADPNDVALLRNARFSLGASLYASGRYDDAIRIYANAASLYRTHPEALEALTQLFACYRRLNRPAEAETAIARAKAALQRIDSTVDFKQTTNYSRQEWGQRLDQLAAL